MSLLLILNEKNVWECEEFPLLPKAVANAQRPPLSATRLLFEILNKIKYLY